MSIQPVLTPVPAVLTLVPGRAGTHTNTHSRRHGELCPLCTSLHRSLMQHSPHSPPPLLFSCSLVRVRFDLDAVLVLTHAKSQSDLGTRRAFWARLRAGFRCVDAPYGYPQYISRRGRRSAQKTSEKRCGGHVKRYEGAHGFAVGSRRRARARRAHGWMCDHPPCCVGACCGASVFGPCAPCPWHAYQYSAAAHGGGGKCDEGLSSHALFTPPRAR